MLHRPRRLRQNAAFRDLAAETHLLKSDLIAPLFVTEGAGLKQEIPSMPGYYRYSLDLLEGEVRELAQLGCKALLLFAKIPDSLKDNAGIEALNPGGLMPHSIRMIKQWVPELILMTDVALDPYSMYGHDGIVAEGKVVNDATVQFLGQMAVVHAQAGADVVAPSDMMDGRVAGIRKALDEAGYEDTAIMAYTAKYASCFYGPFREALDSAPVELEQVPRDKKTYQMNPANAREATREATLDSQEGADILMVKPAMAYLDIIRLMREQIHLPVSAYQVSGEYAMIKAAAQQGWINEEAAMWESLIAIKRAGADLIATYFVKTLLQGLP